MGFGRGYCYPAQAAPVATAPVAPFGGFALIVVLFILLIIVGAAWCA